MDGCAKFATSHQIKVSLRLTKQQNVVANYKLENAKFQTSHNRDNKSRWHFV